MKSAMGVSQHPKGLSHKRHIYIYIYTYIHTGNETVQYRIILQASPLHITHHTTVIDGEGNCVWEYLTAEQNRGIALLHEDTFKK
jgi:hypothetical protein